MAFAVEGNETPDPIEVGLLGPVGEVMEPEHLGALVPQAGVGIGTKSIQPAACPTGMRRIGGAGRGIPTAARRWEAGRRLRDLPSNFAWAMRRVVTGLARLVGCVIQSSVERVVHKRFNP